uniref:Uncharacterized protein n=1 Tax=Arundo donax TaxID=35708 RepID=A0A0A9TF37_ARUDO
MFGSHGSTVQVPEMAGRALAGGALMSK